MNPTHIQLKFSANQTIPTAAKERIKELETGVATETVVDFETRVKELMRSFTRIKNNLRTCTKRNGPEATREHYVEQREKNVGDFEAAYKYLVIDRKMYTDKRFWKTLVGHRYKKSYAEFLNI